MASPYDVAIHLSLKNDVSAGLALIAKDMLGLNASAEKLQKAFEKMGLGLKMAVGGAAVAVAGYELGKGIDDVLKKGGELVKQQMLLRNMGGVSEAEILHTTALAQLDTQKIIGTTIAENIKGIREMMGVMPNLAEAQSKYPMVMQAAKVLESYTGTPAAQSLQTLAKAIELRGGGTDPTTHKLDPQRFVHESEAVVKAVIASGGLANAQRLLQMVQQAGPMAKMIDNPDTFYKGILTALMDMGGFRSGTALTALGRQLLGGKMTKPTAEEMERLGLLRPGSWHKSGTGVFVDPGGLTGESIMKDPSQGFAAWMNDVLIPAFASHGYTKNADVMQELYRAFGTETARRLAGLYIQNADQVKRDATLYDNALGGKAYGAVAGGDYEANIKNVQDAFTNLMSAAGAPMVKDAIWGLHGLADAINALAAVAVAHPEAMRVVGDGAMIASGLAVIGGAVVSFAGMVALSRLALAGAGWIGGGGAAAAAAAGATTAGVATAGGLSGFSAWKAAQQVSETKTLWGRILGGASLAGGRLAGPLGLVMMLRDIGELINPTTPLGAPYRLDTVSPDWREKFERSTRSQRDLHQGADMEAARGRAMMSLPAPVVNTTTNVTTNLNVDGRTLASVVEKYIAQGNRTVTSSSGHDGRSGWAAPDVRD